MILGRGHGQSEPPQCPYRRANAIGVAVISYIMSKEVPDSDAFAAVRLTANEIANLREDLFDFALRELDMSASEAREYALNFIEEYRARLNISNKPRK